MSITQDVHIVVQTKKRGRESEKEMRSWGKVSKGPKYEVGTSQVGSGDLLLLLLLLLCKRSVSSATRLCVHRKSYIMAQLYAKLV